MVTSEQRRVQNMLVTVYKCLHGAAPSNLRSYLQMRDVGSHFLRGFAKLKPPAVRTETFGIRSVILPQKNGTNYQTVHGRLKPFPCLNKKSKPLRTNRRSFAFIDKSELVFFGYIYLSMSVSFSILYLRLVSDYWMRQSIWRIMQIEEGVIRLSRI